MMHDSSPICLLAEEYRNQFFLDGKFHDCVMNTTAQLQKFKSHCMRERE